MDRVGRVDISATSVWRHHKEVASEKGSWQPLLDDKEVIGAVLRTRTNVAPVFVSIGHKIDLQTAIDYTLRCTTKYRLPETTRFQ